ncbi:MAG: glycosyltransferase family 39 protein [Paracoccaceae bacterium]
MAAKRSGERGASRGTADKAARGAPVKAGRGGGTSPDAEAGSPPAGGGAKARDAKTRASAERGGGAAPASKGAPKPRGKRAGLSSATPAAPATREAGWALAALGVVLAVACLRLAVNAAGWVPIHFDEAQYWAYGQELAWGYFSKPPLVAALIRLATDLGGDTLFALRAGAVVAHAVVALALYALGRKLFDPATGFWAAVAYTAAPGVSVSAMVMSTDPVMMAFWALALVAWIRAAESGRDRDWALTGALVGLGALAKYTMLALPAGMLGYALFSARGRDWRGAGIAAGAGLVVLAPNLWWNATNGFATVTHVAEDADPGEGYGNIGAFLEFFGSQFGVIGPIVFLAILAAFWRRRDWAGDWRMRLLAWQAGTLLFAMLALAYATRAQPNWAAPAYVAGSLLAARFLLASGFGRLLRWHAGIGVVAAGAVYARAALYAAEGEGLARGPDPFKKMRLSEPFCDRALPVMGEMGAEVLLADNRRRLSECMFLGGLGWDEVAVWNPDRVENHHEMVASLRPGDRRAMLLATLDDDGAAMAARFEEAELVDEGRFATHRDRSFGYELWWVKGFRGYPDDGGRG